MLLNVWRDRWYIRAEVHSIRHALVSFTAPESERVPAGGALDIVAHDVAVTVEAPTGTKVGADGELHAIVGLLRNATRPARSR